MMMMSYLPLTHCDFLYILFRQDMEPAWEKQQSIS